MLKWFTRFIQVVVLLWFCVSAGFAVAALITTKGDIGAASMMFLFWWVKVMLLWGM